MDYIHIYYIFNKNEHLPVLDNGFYSLQAYNNDTGMLTLKNTSNAKEIDVYYHEINIQCKIEERLLSWD